jgi:hypothetical protein
VVPLVVSGSGLGLLGPSGWPRRRPGDEIVRINTEARPLALQVALVVPILAGLVGLLNSFPMMGLPDLKPSGAAEGMALG